MADEIHVLPSFVASRRRKRLQFSLRVVLCLLTGTSIVVLLCCWMSGAMKPQIGQSVDRNASGISGLPENAIGVSFFEPGLLGPLRAYEFTTNESTFRSWASNNSWPVGEITKPQRIQRFSFCAGMPNVASDVEISNGLYFQTVHGDSGVYVAFDRDHTRAYFFRHSR